MRTNEQTNFKRSYFFQKNIAGVKFRGRLSAQSSKWSEVLEYFGGHFVGACPFGSLSKKPQDRNDFLVSMQ